jgi:outer membrane lipoprotein SlyB
MCQQPWLPRGVISPTLSHAVSELSSAKPSEALHWSHPTLEEIPMKYSRTLSLALAACLVSAAVGLQAQTATTAPAAPLTAAQVKAQQDLAAAQAAADKANKEAADAQAKAKAAQDAANAKAAQQATALQVAQTEKARLAQVAALCDTCGIVTGVRSEKRKGKGGALGIIGGAVGGGLLGSQVGSGDGKTVATVGGAVGGAVIGNEIQKRLNRKTIHITTIQLKDGSTRSYESEAAPTWAVGNSVKLDSAANTVVKL